MEIILKYKSEKTTKIIFALTQRKVTMLKLQIRIFKTNVNLFILLIINKANSAFLFDK